MEVEFQNRSKRQRAQGFLHQQNHQSQQGRRKKLRASAF